MSERTLLLRSVILRMSFAFHRPLRKKEKAGEASPENLLASFLVILGCPPLVRPTLQDSQDVYSNGAKVEFLSSSVFFCTRKKHIAEERKLFCNVTRPNRIREKYESKVNQEVRPPNADSKFGFQGGRGRIPPQQIPFFPDATAASVSYSPTA